MLSAFLSLFECYRDFLVETDHAKQDMTSMYHISESGAICHDCIGKIKFICCCSSFMIILWGHFHVLWVFDRSGSKSIFLSVQLNGKKGRYFLKVSKISEGTSVVTQ